MTHARKPLKPQQYVCGFAFDPSREFVVLIRKNRPEWQKGKRNGVGGKMEEHHETIYHAQEREFFEETGVRIPASQWRHFCTLSDTRTGAVIHFLETTTDIVHEVKSKTDEKVELREVARLKDAQCVRSVAWLIPLALDGSKSLAHVFTTREYSTLID